MKINKIWNFLRQNISRTEIAISVSAEVILIVIFMLAVHGGPSLFKLKASLGAVYNPAINIYVSTAGNDANPGTASQPVATLGRAREIIRNLPRPLSGPVNVYLRGGTYVLNETFKLDDPTKDSGSEAASITYQSYLGEKAVISGGKKLNLNWSAYNQNIFAASVGDLEFNSLFVGEKRAVKARIPDIGYYEIPKSKTDADRDSAFYFDSGQINSSWRNLNDVEIVVSKNFIQSRFN
ncbi:MAG: hypothetical protein Q8N88_01395, partial [Nanoarchaeota archaeon]|nr:hypothetical protein [Nanoarchaeota archaeon]